MNVNEARAAIALMPAALMPASLNKHTSITKTVSEMLYRRARQRQYFQALTKSRSFRWTINHACFSAFSTASLCAMQGRLKPEVFYEGVEVAVGI
jgi:hypothetical protein